MTHIAMKMHYSVAVQIHFPLLSAADGLQSPASWLGREKSRNNHWIGGCSRTQILSHLSRRQKELCHCRNSNSYSPDSSLYFLPLCKWKLITIFSDVSDIRNLCPRAQETNTWPCTASDDLSPNTLRRFVWIAFSHLHLYFLTGQHLNICLNLYVYLSRTI